ncbi:hypothetical protein PQS90_13255 [Pseudomonas sp. BLCC-B13]|jgi:hypothetical protein|uniref:hypothetical protein n=1 Tax=Pseudomonas sp. BLCC-B13 TaxID=3025314 RepID=UPI00234E378D|nr:hypothetical protein [Pseudomonas sp. BLCC-B13]MDC7826119.1 hypothetical protein [Pseudomonas sp. BLCC-B13]
MKHYYVVAEKDPYPAEPHSSEWPKIVGYSFVHRSFLFMEGKGHGLMGAEVHQDSASLTKWRDLFVELGAEWFLDLLKLNTFLDEDEFLTKLKPLIGHSPKIITY